MLVLAPAFLSSCLKDDDIDYNEWEQRNTKFVADKEMERDGLGEPVYTRYAPAWAPDAFVLLKWENDRFSTASSLSPMDNSVVRVKYALDNIDGTRISDSYSARASYGDSIYQCRPNDNIVGFWAALTQMKVGDRVTAIMPAVSAYGKVNNGTIPAYSTLVYTIELVSIPRYEVP